jgi:hypothetical protein
VNGATSHLGQWLGTGQVPSRVRLICRAWSYQGASDCLDSWPCNRFSDKLISGRDTSTLLGIEPVANESVGIIKEQPRLIPGRSVKHDATSVAYRVAHGFVALRRLTR